MIAPNENNFAPRLESNSAVVPYLRLDAEQSWLVWQLVDSAFPTGGFAHSSGLEAAWQLGELNPQPGAHSRQWQTENIQHSTSNIQHPGMVRGDSGARGNGRPDRACGSDGLVEFIEASLVQLGHANLPLVLTAFDAPERLRELDDLCDAFTSNHVANRASRAQGRAFLMAIERIFSFALCVPQSAVKCGHFAPVFGACLRRLEISREMTGRLFFFNHLRGVLAAAVRLNIVGPMAAQKLQHELSVKAELVLKQCLDLSLDDLAQTSPVLDLWQGAQDRLYARLFQS